MLYIHMHIHLHNNYYAPCTCIINYVYTCILCNFDTNSTTYKHTIVYLACACAPRHYSHHYLFCTLNHTVMRLIMKSRSPTRRSLINFGSNLFFESFFLGNFTMPLDGYPFLTSSKRSSNSLYLQSLTSYA